MKGWLVINGFVKSDKFQQLYQHFLQSANQLNISLKVISTCDLAATTDFSDLERPNFVLFWDKDVCLAKRLEKAGFRLFNNARAVEICDSKSLTALELDGFPMPQTLFSPKTFDGVGYPDLQFVEKAVNLLGLPIIIKQSYGSFGQQVYLATTLQQAKDIVTELAGKDFIMQKFIAESCGRDVRVNVVGGKVVNAILRQSDTDFRSNITLGGKMQPYVPTPQQIDLAESVCRKLGLDFAGVDILLSSTPLLCEVNSNPHFKSTLDCTGVDLSKHILQHILKEIE